MKETRRLESFQDHSYLNFVITSHSETYLQFHESTVLLKEVSPFKLPTAI